MALVKPYGIHGGVGLVWLAVGAATVVIEVTGFLRRRSEATSRDRGSLLVMRAFQIPAGVVLVTAPTWAPGADIHPQLVASIVGVVVFALGEATRIWARLTLGRYFTYTVQTSSDQPVITSGPYRFVRHPSYTGVLLILLGVGVGWGNWVGLVVLAVLGGAGLAYRIRVEESALLADLGDRYAQYAASHKRLVPGVW